MRFALVAIAANTAIVGQASAKDFADTFINVCGKQVGGVAEVERASSASDWTKISPTSSAIVQQGVAASPRASAKKTITEQGEADLLVDQLVIRPPPPLPATAQKRSCILSIPADDPSADAKIKAWLGPEVSGKAQTSPQGKAYFALWSGSKFIPLPDGLAQSDPQMLRVVNILVLFNQGPPARTTLVQISPDD